MITPRLQLSLVEAIKNKACTPFTEVFGEARGARPS
jgi:hypothetical protein